MAILVKSAMDVTPSLSMMLYLWDSTVEPFADFPGVQAVGQKGKDFLFAGTQFA